MGSETGKLRVWFVETLNAAVRIRFPVISFTNNLERKERFSWGLSLIKILLTFLYHMQQWHFSGNLVLGDKMSFYVSLGM